MDLSELHVTPPAVPPLPLCRPVLLPPPQATPCAASPPGLLLPDHHLQTASRTSPDLMGDTDMADGMGQAKQERSGKQVKEEQGKGLDERMREEEEAARMAVTVQQLWVDKELIRARNKTQR